VNLPSEFTLWIIAAIGLGLIFGVAIIAFMNQLNFMFYQIPDSFNEDADLYLTELASNNLFLSGKIISIFTGCFFAGGIAKLVNRSIQIRDTTAAGIILILVGLIDLLSAPYPVWYWIISMLVYVPSSIAGYYFIKHYREQTVE
jgi:hypothetical protein